MAIKSLFVTFVLSVFLTSCLQTPGIVFRKNPNQRSNTQMGQSDVDGPKVVRINEVSTHDQSKPFRPKLGLVLGPGLAYSFAHIGVLKKLIEAKIPVTTIVGLGWSTFSAIEYATEGSVHGLEWRASRSKELQSLSNLSFWKSSFDEKNIQDLKKVAKAILTTDQTQDHKSTFSCSLYSNKVSKIVFSKHKGFEVCAAVPPLFNPGKSYSPYIMGSRESLAAAKDLGAEKVIYIDVLTSDDLWRDQKNSISGSSYWYWALAKAQLKEDFQFFDYVQRVDMNRSEGLLDFSKVLSFVGQGEVAGEKLVRFLKKEYQY